MMMEANIVTEEVLKVTSGEFCLESIYVLNFSCKGIFSAGAITKCLNLSILDLSSNHLESVSELNVLTSLERLDLSDNCISQLDGLDKLENLTRLELAGNKLSSFDVFLPLSSLFNLKHLTLQQPYQCSSLSPHSEQAPVRLSNPVCQEMAYVATMSELLPVLVWLDQEVLSGKPGSKFYEKCKDIEGRNGGWMEDYGKQKSGLPALMDPLQEVVFTEDDDDDAKIEGLLAECTDTSLKVQRLLNDVKSELSSRTN